MTTTYLPLDAHETLAQIGTLTRLAVSGGRAELYADAVILPCGTNRRVEVRLNAADLYDVFRTRLIVNGPRRGERVTESEQFDVYCDQLSEAVYRAGTWK